MEEGAHGFLSNGRAQPFDEGGVLFERRILRRTHGEYIYRTYQLCMVGKKVLRIYQTLQPMLGGSEREALLFDY